MKNVSSSSRWWENYLVRYFIPSVVGMLIVRWLDINIPNSFSHYLPVFLINDWGKFNFAHLIIWLLYGSLYCYIASYPIMIFHATRVLDFKDRSGKLYSLLINPYTVTILFTIFAYICAIFNCLILAFIIVTIYTIYQLYLLYTAYSKMNNYMFSKEYTSSIAYAYLYALSKRRSTSEETTTSNDKSDPGKETNTKTNNTYADMTESYKHLREHGNTAFIFILELALCPVLYVALKNQQKLLDFSYLTIFIIIWIIPSVFIHLFAQHLERRFSLFKYNKNSDTDTKTTT